jgi:hypothetical protein
MERCHCVEYGDSGDAMTHLLEASSSIQIRLDTEIFCLNALVASRPDHPYVYIDRMHE